MEMESNNLNQLNKNFNKLKNKQKFHKLKWKKKTWNASKFSIWSL